MIDSTKNVRRRTELSATARVCRRNTATRLCRSFWRTRIDSVFPVSPRRHSVPITTVFNTNWKFAHELAWAVQGTTGGRVELVPVKVSLSTNHSATMLVTFIFWQNCSAYFRKVGRKSFCRVFHNNMKLRQEKWHPVRKIRFPLDLPEIQLVGIID